MLIETSKPVCLSVYTLVPTQIDQLSPNFQVERSTK